jgi:tetratricopeptide (TPR) repeat protein
MKLSLILVLLSLTCYSQVNDSVLYQIKNIENDTEKVNQLYKIGFEIRNTDPEFSYKIASLCQLEATKSKSALHLAKSYNLLALLFYKKGDYNKALQFQRKSLQLSQSIQNQFWIAINQSNLGNIYSDINYPKLAEYCYLQSLQASNKTENTLQITRCLINIGVLKHDQKEFTAAVKQFEEALIYANSIGNQELVADCYNNIGTILREQNKLDSALLYLEEGLKIRQLIDNEFELADSYNNIAMVYILQKNFNQVSNYILLANEICSKYEYPDALVELYQTQSEFYEVQQNFEQANIFLKKHYSLRDSLNKINQEDKDLVFVDEENIPSRQQHTNVNTSNHLLLFSVIILLIGIPLFLIRLKR